MAIFFLLLLGSCATAWAQNYSVQPFQSANLFPSAELYDIIEDERGFKWVASDVGLLKIVGNRVEHYTIKNGLAENVILRFFKTPQRHIWATGLLGSISGIRQDSIFKKSTLPVHLYQSSSSAYLLHLVEVGQKLRFSTMNNTYLHEIRERQLHSTHNTLTRNVVIQETEDHQVMLYYPHNIREKNAPLPAWIIQKNGQEKPLPVRFKQKTDLHNQYFILNDSVSYLSNLNELVKIVNGKPVAYFEIPHRILRIYFAKNQVLIGTFQGGLYALRAGKLEKLAIPDFENMSISSMLEDREENIWFTTLEKGLWVARFPDIHNLYKGEQVVKKITTYQGKVACILQNNFIFDENEKKELLLLNQQKATLNDVLYLGNEIYYITNIGILDKAGKIIGDYKYFLRSYSRLSEKEILLFGGASAFVWHTTQQTKENLHIKDRVFCSEALGNKKAVLGTQNTGVWLVEKTGKAYQARQITPNFRVNCLAKVQENLIAVGTNEQGVLLINPAGKTIEKLKNLPERIECLTAKGHILFIGTRQGLYVYEMQGKEMRVLNADNFLSFNEIVDVKSRQDTLYVAGKYEVFAVRLSNLFERTASPAIQIKQQGMNFEILQNSYKYAKTIVYHFILKNEVGKELQHQKSLINTYQFQPIAGNYSLEMYVTDSLSFTKSNVIKKQLFVPTPWAQTWWFLIFCVILLMGLIALVVHFIIQNIRRVEARKRAIQQQITALESSALQAQMNPHFIFNAINSIQAFILQNKTEEAHFYLAEFAKLFRLILNHSRQKEVTLEEEIELLRLYIVLEAQRMKDTIDFQIEIAEDVEIDNTLIPTMLLQPIVENAIWHGLKQDIRPKIIRLSAFVQDSCLHLHLYNNGKSIEKKALPTFHASKGLLIVQERIKILFDKTPAFPTFSLENASDAGVITKIVVPLAVEF